MKQVRWELAITLAIGIMLGATMVLAMSGSWAAKPGAKAKVPQMLSAHGFSVVDSNGKVRAILGTENKGTHRPFFSLLDENEKQRVCLIASDNLPSGLLLKDEQGKTRISMIADSDGPNLYLLDEKGKPRVTVAVTSPGTPHIEISDAEGTSRAIMGSAPLSGKDEYFFALRDDAGTMRVIATAIGEKSDIEMYDRNGEVLWKAR